MSRPRPPLDLLADILTEAAYATQFVQGQTLELFQADPMRMRAVAHSLQTVGEAAYQLPADVKARASDIPWHQIVNMRHLLVHHYWKTNLPILWSTVHEDLPVLTAAVRTIRDQLLAAPPAPEAPDA